MAESSNSKSAQSNGEHNFNVINYPINDINFHKQERGICFTKEVKIEAGVKEHLN